MPRPISNLSITLSANAGISIAWHGYKIWVDALHTEKAPGFSSLSRTMWATIQSSDVFAPPDLICFTHCHGDHYSRELTAHAQALWPNARLLLPQQEFDSQLLLAGSTVKISLGELSLQFLRLPHEKAKESSVPHYGLLLSDDSFHVLISGDCEIASPILTRHLDSIPIDLAILDFPWLTLERGRQYLRTILRPQHLFLYHLPFPEDDINGYLDAAYRSRSLLDLPDIRFLTRPFQQETV